MGVPVSDFDAFVTDSITNCDGGESHLDQLRNMCMPKVMNADLFDSGCFGCTCHFPGQLICGNRKQSVFRCDCIKLGNVVLDLFFEEIGDFDYPVAFGCFGFGNDIPLVNALIGLGDGKRVLFKIKILGS